MTTWPKSIIQWQEKRVAYLSVPFTWMLPAAARMAAEWRFIGYDVRAGGPAVDLMPYFPELRKTGLAELATCGGSLPALERHNPEACFTSRGCVRRCSFCAVWRIEPVFEELTDWEPRPIVCDNNLLATSRRHFDRVIDRLAPVPDVDFNQGLDARLLKAHHIERLRDLDLAKVRFSWDSTREEGPVMDAIARVRAAGFPKRRISVYVLVNHGESPAEALHRVETIHAAGSRAFVQRFNPLDTLKRNSYLSPEWTDHGLNRFLNYWNRLRWLESVPFEEYRYHDRPLDYSAPETRKGRNLSLPFLCQ